MAVGRGLCMADGRGLTHQKLYLCLDHRFFDGGGGGACVRWAGLVRLIDRVLTITQSH